MPHLRSRAIAVLTAAVALCLLAAADAPNGKLVIARAVYGDLAEDNVVDVTPKIAALVKDNSLSITASKAALGDAPGGASRQLKVSYIVDGIYRSKTVADGEILDISTRLFIRKALYGDLAGGRTTDVTEQVAAAIRTNRLAMKATNEEFGDPANGVVKSLRVDYTFDGVDHSKTVGENATITIPD